MLVVIALMIVMVVANVSGGGDSDGDGGGDGWTSAVNSDVYGNGEYGRFKWWSLPTPQERVQTSHL